MAVDSLLPGELDELLRQAAAELRQNLETGNDCRVETILNAFPSLASDPHSALELIVLEFQLRRERGQNPEPLQWYERFPQWRERLRDRLEGLASNVVASAEQETVAMQSVRPGVEGRAVASAADDKVPLLGRHEILEEIGRGGMGVVYRARDLVLERIVALKVIRSGSLASAEEVSCFYREARAAAALRHPNIVPIYGMGLHEQQHGFSMALFPRGSLSEHLNDYYPDLRAAVMLMVKVARAVQAAHEQGIIHRDLKPGNILLDEQGEPVVGDFGLAKRQDVSATVTLSGRIIGTPAYMAPEQARGETVTRAADIWALGVILYELLTGSRPFRGVTVDEVKEKVVHADPVSLRRLRAELPTDLETIVLKCLSKEPIRRYGSAAELADDLERWQRGEPIQARSDTLRQRLRRQFHRRVGRKGVVLLLVGLLLMGAGAAGVWGIFSYFAPEARAQRVLEAMERDLLDEKPVTLIGETGPPKRYQIRIDKNTIPSLSMQSDKPFSLSSLGICLLELIRDPKQPHYRFSAETRLYNNRTFRPYGRVGIFFQADEQETSLGPEQRCCVFCYGAVGRADLMQVCCFCCLDPQFTNGLPKPWYGSLMTQQLDPRLFADWHKLAVEVVPNGFIVFFDDRRVREFKFWEHKLQPGLDVWWTKVHGLTVTPPSPTFTPRGALGLYVEGEGAEFRNVAVEPLSEK